MSTIVERYRCTRNFPCPICGSTDYDMAIKYDDGSVIYHCHKATGSYLSVGGKEYVCVKENHEECSGIFNLYQEKSEKERIDAEKKRAWMNSPDFEIWKQKKGLSDDFKPRFYEKSSTASAPVEVTFAKREVKTLLPRSNKELDKIYRYLLSLLCLEAKHEERLRAEWSSSVYPTIADELLKKYPVRSFPPEDRIRYKSKEIFRNPSRKQLIQKLVSKFGSLESVPGIYMREGTYWNDKPEQERWTFSFNEGTIFPCFDENGLIYRLRIKVEYYDLTVKDHKFNGMSGTLYHKYGENGDHQWWFKESTMDFVGSSPKAEFLVPNKKLVFKDGIPKIGKPANKYRTISSYFEKNVGNEVVNGYKYGCSGGTPYSLYVPDNANFSIVIGTEGEKKGMVASQIKGCPVLTNPGVGIYKQLFQKGDSGKSVIEFLKEKGMKMFVLCYDADKHDNKNVLAAESGFIKMLQQHGILVAKGDWSESFDKGLDDILLQGVDFTINKA